MVDDVEAVLPFASKDKEIFPIQLQPIQNTQSKDKSLSKRLKDNPKYYKRKIIQAKDLEDNNGSPTTPFFFATKPKPKGRHFYIFSCRAVFKKYDYSTQGK